MKTYIIKCGDFDLYKIGKSEDPAARLYSLQTASPWDLTLETILEGDVEKRLHEVFNQYSTRGEWFNIPDFKVDILEKLLEIAEEEEIEEKTYESGVVTSIRFEPEIREELKRIGKVRGIKYQALVRQILRNWVERQNSESSEFSIFGYDENGEQVEFKISAAGTLYQS